MTCPDCESASRELWHAFVLSCPGCCARAVARSPQYHEAKREGRQTADYRHLLTATGVTHEQAQAAEGADYISKGMA